MATPDKALTDILMGFGIDEADLLGRGGETSVYALDEARVVRICHEGATRSTVEARTSLLSELAASADTLPFAIPTVLDTLEIDTRLITIERRLPGTPLGDVLAQADDTTRPTLIRAYMDAAMRLGDLAVSRPWYGDLVRTDAIHTGTFREYLRQRAADSLAVAGPDFDAIDPTALADALPEPDKPAFIHLDAYPGNMLASEDRITAVIDFGGVALLGDRRLEPLSAAVYLETAITPEVIDADRRCAQAWLAEHGLDQYLEAARRWLAAFWSFARDDATLHHWCRSVLL